jgi:hypothetical protein
VAAALGLGSPTFLAVVRDVPYVVVTDSLGPNGRIIGVVPEGFSSEAIFQQTAPVGLAADADSLYWAIPSTATSGNPSNGEIDRLKLGYGDPSVVLQSAIDPRGLAVDEKNIYWSDFASKGVFQQSLGSDKTMTQLMTTDSVALSLASDGTTLFAANANGNKLFSVPVGGGAVTQLTAISGKSLSVATRYVAVDAKYAYAWFYSSSGAVYLEQLTKPSFGNSRDIASSSNINSFTAPLAADANDVYFIKDKALYRAPTNTNDAPSLIANPVGDISGIAVSNGVLYWLDTGSSSMDGTLYRLVL